MKKLRIHFVLPNIASKPGGGIKIMYEYANRLSLRGHEIHIYHSVVKPFRKNKSPKWFKYLKSIFNLKRSLSWFNFEANVHKYVVLDIKDLYLPNADIIISTWWEMAHRVALLNSQKGIKFNLIQDYEIWTGFEDLVISSYKLNVTNIVISKYLEQLVNNYSLNPSVLLPNAIDSKKFFINREIIERKNNTVIMLYSDEKRKGSFYGLEAFRKLKKEIPDLKVILFSVCKKPRNLESFFEFHQAPDNLRELYNSAKIFVSPSLSEGWALPPAEAMACGCSVICTLIGGHKDYAINDDTALTILPKSTEEIYKNLIYLIKNEDVRIKLAINGHKLITEKFSWDYSVTQLETLFLQSSNN